MTYTILNRTKHFFTELFWNTWNLLILSFVLAAIIFVAEYGQAIIMAVEAHGHIPSESSVNLLVSRTVHYWLFSVDQIPYMDKISVALFWACVAIVLYIVYSFVSRITESMQSQIQVDRLSRTGFLKAVFTHFGEKIVAMIIFFVVGILSITTLWGYWLQLMNGYILGGFDSESLVGFLVGLLGLVLTIYILLMTAYITWLYERRLLA